MGKQFRPMLADTIESVVEQVRFPVLASPKLDGIRCVIMNGQALSRSLKPIPNIAVRRALENLPCLEGCDGELMVKDATFQDITSTFMRRDSVPPTGWYFAVFDCVMEGMMYCERLKLAQLAVTVAQSQHVQIVPQTMLQTAEDVDAYERTVLAHGYEGVMLRRATAPYKFGRSTCGDGALLKLKRFDDSEAEVIGFVERMHNGNEATVSELGLTKRSSAKAGKSASGALGALQVRDLKSRVEFEVGTGFTEAQRVEFWRDQATLLQRVIKYKHFAGGAKDKPRFPVFLGWRSLLDM